MLPSRRPPRYGPHVCAVIMGLLLLISVSFLCTRLSLPDPTAPSTLTHRHDLSDDPDPSHSNSLDNIDDLDSLLQEEEDSSSERESKLLSLYYVDHVTGSIRKAFNKRSIEDWDYDSTFGVDKEEDFNKVGGFGSDDVPLDEDVREKIGSVGGIEDALLLKFGRGKVSPLREGWGDWFEKKGAFLRRDGLMFKSSLGALNPLNNPMLHDPDGTGLTHPDKAVRKLLFDEFRKASPFLSKDC